MWLISMRLNQNVPSRSIVNQYEPGLSCPLQHQLRGNSCVVKTPTYVASRRLLGHREVQLTVFDTACLCSMGQFKDFMFVGLAKRDKRSSTRHLSSTANPSCLASSHRDFFRLGSSGGRAGGA